MHRLMLTLAAAFASLAAVAQNPIIQTWCTTDPAPFVWGDTLYLYTGHDEDGADFFWMQEWRVYATADMVNWTDLGSPLAIETFAWADDRAWAAQLCERGGKFYWYVCLHSKLSCAMAIGVAVGDSPRGPFRDALGRPLVDGSWDYIDPTVLLCSDGRAFLYWGNPELYYAELGDDMVSLRSEVRHFDMDEQSFGGHSLPARREAEAQGMPLPPERDVYTEGPWAMERDGRYYMLYAAGGVPEHIAYSTAPTPTGPWTYRGIVMPQSVSDPATGQVGTDAFTNHCGVAHFKGHDYFFYHNGWLGGGFGRAAAVEEFTYLPDGSLPVIHPTREGITHALSTLCPYRRVEAETMAFSHGVKTEPCAVAFPMERPAKGATSATADASAADASAANATAADAGGSGLYLSEIHDGDWTCLREVDFGPTPAREVSLRAASALRGGTVEWHLDSLTGPLVASLGVTGTGGWEAWHTFYAPVAPEAVGIHDVYLTFHGRKGPRLFNLDWWQLATEASNP